MKQLGIFRIVIGATVWMACLIGCGFAYGEMRVFKNEAGAEIKAELMHGTADTVTIRMENGRELTTEIAKFSAPDQEYIREWIEKNPRAIDYHFDLRYEKKMTGKKERKTSSHEITEEDWVYDIMLENRSRVPVEGLEMRYRVYVQSEHVKGKNEKGIFVKDGKLALPTMDNGERKELRTISVPVMESNLRDGYVYKNGERHRQSDNVAGLWVKIFHDGRRVWEFQSPQKAVKDYPFTDSDAEKIGAKGSEADD
ncbi:MAG: hypothetical protein AAF591_18660 [Verrucomicrobiota bacterium]